MFFNYRLFFRQLFTSIFNIGNADLRFGPNRIRFLLFFIVLFPPLWLMTQIGFLADHILFGGFTTAEQRGQGACPRTARLAAIKLSHRANRPYPTSSISSSSYSPRASFSYSRRIWRCGTRGAHLGSALLSSMSLTSQLDPLPIAG